jgi:lipopolysaccharide transport system permease protein
MPRFRAKLEVTELLPLGETAVRLRLRVRNTSDRAWPAGGPVFLAYQVLDSRAESLLAEGARIPFSAEVPRGGEAEASLDVELPAEAGCYRVLVSPVEEPVAWFYERGSECLALRVEVGGAGGVRASQRRLTAAGRRAERLRRTLTRLLTAPFATILRHRSLIASMVRRDIHGRYRGSMGGLFWTVINPLLLMLTYFFVFAVVLKVRFGPSPETAGPVNFLLYFICGMLPWLAFSEALARAPSVLLEHRMLVTRVVFPVEILPVNVTFAGLAGGFFALLVFLAGLLLFRHSVPATALYLPLVLVPQVMLTIGLCWFLAALGVFLRDVGQFMSFALTLWFFATPICYPESALPPATVALFQKNPVFVMVRSYRAIFLERAAPPWEALGWLAAGGLVAYLLGFAWFYKSRKSFADIL